MVLTSRRVVAHLALLALTVGLVVLAADAAFADGAVTVQNTEAGGRYTPQETTIAVGESVTWTFEDGGHSVTGDAFDSHPGCEDRDLFGVSGCAAPGEVYVRVFDLPGSYPYQCRIHGSAMAGTVVVRDGQPSETPTEPTPTPTEPTPTASPTPEPTEPEPTEPEPTEPEPTETATEPEPTEPEPTEPEPTATETAVPTPVPQPTELPSVRPIPSTTTPEPIPEPTFEAFPDVEGSNTDDPDEDDDLGGVAVGDEGGSDGTGDLVLRVLGGLAVVGTAGTFSRVVLFGDPWRA